MGCLRKVRPIAHLPQMTEGEEVVEDYVAMRLTLRKHPMAFLRPKLSPQAGVPVTSQAPPDATGLPKPRRGGHPRNLRHF